MVSLIQPVDQSRAPKLRWLVLFLSTDISSPITPPPAKSSPAAIGHEVHVITSRQRYDDPRAALPENENVNGVQVHRVASSRFGRAALSGRALDYLSFYRSVRRQLDIVARPGDMVIAKTDPPLLSLVLESTARNRGTYLVNWLQDIYPETAAVLRVPLIRGPALALLRGLRNRSLRKTDATVVVGDLMAQRIKEFGVPAARVHVIANWCDDETIRPAARTEQSAPGGLASV
jgi:colanic acid biosynthesis glycosyl transferase WcaI